MSKCKAIEKKARLDNGRVISAKYVKLIMTNVDFEIFTKCYDITNLNILEFYVSINDYLSPTFVKYILELYKDKTELKDIEEFADKYAISKQYINSMFGMMCTKNITDEILITGKWEKNKINEQLCNSTITNERQ